MTRNRKSAREAGSKFEHQQARYWAETLKQPKINPGGKQGVKDKGDLLNVEVLNAVYELLGNLTVECKDTAPPPALGTFWKEADRERKNNVAIIYDDGDVPEGPVTRIEIPSIAAIVVHKRRGTTDPGKQWVHTTVEELIAIITGNRDHITD